VGCTVLQMWRGGAPWALQVRVLHTSAVAGHEAVPDPPERSAGARTRRSGRHTEIPDPSRGRSGTPAASAERPSLRGTWRRQTPSRVGSGSGVIRVVRWSLVSRSWQNSNGNCVEHVSSRVAGSHSAATASGMAEQWPELADGTSVTATVGNGGLTPSVLGAVEEWLAFNASVRWVGER
jgi:hypothetical protein